MKKLVLTLMTLLSVFAFAFGTFGATAFAKESSDHRSSSERHESDRKQDKEDRRGDRSGAEVTAATSESKESTAVKNWESAHNMEFVGNTADLSQ